MKGLGFRVPHCRNLEVYHDPFLNSAKWMKLEMVHCSPQCGIGTFLPQEWDTGGACFAALTMHEILLPSLNYDAFLRDGTLPDREDSLVGRSKVKNSFVLLAKQVGVDAIGALDHCYQVDLVMSERTVPCYPGPTDLCGPCEIKFVSQSMRFRPPAQYSEHCVHEITLLPMDQLIARMDCAPLELPVYPGAWSIGPQCDTTFETFPYPGGESSDGLSDDDHQMNVTDQRSS